MKGTVRCLRIFVGMAAAAGALSAQSFEPALLSGVRWRMAGPFRGGRVLAVALVPGQPDHFYFGAVGGGVWETRNAGRTWEPIFDGQPVASIGAIAVAPSDPRVLYVGSGEADMRSDISYGNGMYRSRDGGKKWSRAGLEATRQIGRILVDPRDANRVYVAALGHAYGPNPERGVFRSTDGGQTWSRVLFKDENTGAIDVALDPSHPKTLLAALWQTRRPPWNAYPPSNGPGSGLYRSDDGGDTWKPVAGGFPTEKLGRIGLAYAPSDPRRVYALVDARPGGLWVSDDGGETWTAATHDRRIWERGWYFGGVTVDPSDANTVYACDVSMYRSTDAGRTFLPVKGAPGGDDYHELRIDPSNPRRMIVGSDQGAVVTVDGGRTWSSWYNQPTAQLYHGIADDRFPYWIYGAQQDSGAAATPSRSDYSSITLRDWRPIAVGGENGYIAPDPSHPDVLFGGSVARFDWTTLQEQDVDPTLAYPGDHRGEWTLPLTISPRPPHALYFGNQFVFRTTDGGQHWERISPDLTRESPAGRRRSTRRRWPTARHRGRGAAWCTRSPHRRSWTASSGPAPTTAFSGLRGTMARTGATRRRPASARGRRSRSSRPRISTLGRHTRRWTATGSTTSPRISTGRATPERRGPPSSAASRPGASSTWCGRIPSAADSCTRAPRRASSSPSTTASTGRRCREICPTARSATSPCAAATS